MQKAKNSIVLGISLITSYLLCMFKIVSFFHKILFSYIVLFAIFLVPLSLYPVYAADPLDQFAFQGILKDASGNLLTATKDFTLQLYDTLTGGSSLWSEDHQTLYMFEILGTVLVSGTADGKEPLQVVGLVGILADLD